MKNNKVLDNIWLTLVFIFLFLPIAILIIFSFNKSRLNIMFTGFTLDWYKELFNNSVLLEALINTLIVAVISTVISTVIGTISAYGLKKYDFKGKKLINELLYIPIVIPEIVLGISLLCIYSFMKLELGMFSLILSHIAFSIPFVIINVNSAIESMSANLEEAAADLGASKFKTFFHVVLPSLMPGIVSGAGLAFTLSLDDVVISYFTAGPDSNTLPLQIFSMIKSGVTPDVNALITVLLLMIFTGIFIYMSISLRRIKREGV
jgi:spermidine/putrescine transport system permease protein